MQRRQGTELDEKLAGMVKKGCNLVKQKCESSIKELGEAIMDCLKRRDAKLKSLIQSTPVAISTPVTHLASAASAVQTFGSCFHSFPNKAAIKLEFPRFGSMEGEDPIDYLEKCEEYLAVWPMSDSEILAPLPSVLTHTAKDWWVAVKGVI